MQRSGTTGDIAITGLVGTGTHSIEARWNGGAWAEIQASATGTFSGSLTNQPHGQGVLEVRYVDQPWQMATTAPVGIGDVFVIGGQSNAMGFGSNYQAYATSDLRAGLFAFDYAWKNLVDPTHSDSGQIDSVNDNGSSPSGSVWPLIATRYLTNQPCPVAFVPCSLSGSAITAWQPSGGATNRSSLYGSMVWRGHYVAGGAKAVLWWQGEYEAKFGAGSYYLNLTNISANINADMGGIKLMPAKLQTCSGDYPHQAAVNAAIGQAWTDDPNCVTGPDLSGLTNDDGVHLRSDSNLAAAAELWWNAIKSAYYP